MLDSVVYVEKQGEAETGVVREEGEGKSGVIGDENCRVTVDVGVNGGDAE